MPSNRTSFLSRLSLSILAVAAISTAAPTRYRDDVFKEVRKSENFPFAKPKAYHGADQELYLNVYEPLGGTGATRSTPYGIHGIINCWGGVPDSTWLENGELPALSFHGTGDSVMPYDKGHALGNPALATVGSACIHRVLTRAGVPSVLKPFEGMGHGMSFGEGDAREDTLVDMTRDFARDVLFGGGPPALGSPVLSP
jgi:pimeloyl-ACP methyl ester carboxylesterase